MNSHEALSKIRFVSDLLKKLTINRFIAMKAKIEDLKSRDVVLEGLVG